MKSNIYDINCLLYFLRINKTNLLEKEFKQIIISNKTYNNLNNPSIPENVRDKLNNLIDKNFVKVEEINFNTKVFDFYYNLNKNYKTQVLGEGEASSIALAVVNNGIISYTNPDAISNYLEEYNLECITVEDILNNLYKKSIITKKELDEILKES